MPSSLHSGPTPAPALHGPAHPLQRPPLPGRTGPDGLGCMQFVSIRLDAEGIYLHGYQLLEPTGTFKGDLLDKNEEISDIQS